MSFRSAPVIRLLLSAGIVSALTAQQQSPTWVERSNQNAMIVIKAMVTSTPEAAGMYRLQGYDEEISRLVDDRGPFYEFNTRSFDSAMTAEAMGNGRRHYYGVCRPTTR